MNNTLIDKMNNFCGRLYSFSPSPTAYRLTYVIFIALHIFTAFFHEPWYDEAQAWLIARDASYYDILFDIPHYEGHPPLWHLILSIPAKAGLPFELSLSAIMLIFSALWVYLIMFRSPFCGLLKLLLPFTYYVFYQYGVIARPYVLVGLALALAAMFHSSRDEKPLRYILSLLLLCAVHAYGIIISGGLAAVWCLEIFIEYKGSKPISALFKDKRCYNLLFLLVCALALILCIMPNENTYTITTNKITIPEYVLCLIRMFINLPADCTLFGINTNLARPFLTNLSFSPDYLSMSIIGGILICSILLLTYQKKQLLNFIIPYCMFTAFGTIVYFSEHHSGIALLFFIHILWISFNNNDNKKAKMLNNNILIIPKLSLVVCVSMNLIWSVSAIFHDTTSLYWYSKETADFIEEYELSNLKIMSPWYREFQNETFGAENIQFASVSINAYFDNNIFYYFNNGNPDKSYSDYKAITNLEETTFIKWQADIPDVIIGPPNIDNVYDGKISLSDYTCVKNIKYYQIKKLGALQQNFYIYIRNDLMENYPDLSAVE